MSRLSRVLGLFLFGLAATVIPTFGQSIDLGGRAYVDYFYNIAGPDGASSGAAEDLHGFRFRRLYLTTDFTLSDAFTGRARVEADEGTDGQAVVKDLSLRWAYSGGHSATLGITPPPAFGLAEGVWGYRSLAPMVMDRQDIADSRDFGLRLDGPITDGTVRYAVMFANNGTVRPETDKYKRVYGQVQVRPTDRLLFVLGADQAGYNDERDSATRLSAFGGYSRERFRVGVDGYWSRVAMTEGDPRTRVGASLFGVLQVASNWDLVARFDRSQATRPGPDRYETFVLGAVAYRPHPNVVLTPNLRVSDPNDTAAETTARMTVEVNF